METSLIYGNSQAQVVEHLETNLDWIYDLRVDNGRIRDTYIVWMTPAGLSQMLTKIYLFFANAFV